MKRLSSRDRLLELAEVERRLRPFDRRYLGVREIPLDAVEGTDSRASDFTRDFRPLYPFSRDRLRSLEDAFADGAFPPIVTVKLGDVYFVIDGHHRTTLARRKGAEMIDADVTELIARVPLPAGADMLEVVLRELERIFLEDSGLAKARPGQRVSLSRPSHYLELLENIQVHGYHFMRGRGRMVASAEIAADWYDAIYLPTLAAIDRLRLDRLYRGAPPGDLFLVLHRHRRDAFPSTGCPHLAQTVVSVIGDGARSRRRPSVQEDRPSICVIAADPFTGYRGPVASCGRATIWWVLLHVQRWLAYPRHGQFLLDVGLPYCLRQWQVTVPESANSPLVGSRMNW